MIVERNISLDKAKTHWLDVIEAHGLTKVELTYETNGYQTQLCFLKNDRMTVRGVGKGKNLSENTISAYYEALEYYLSGINYNPYPIIKGSLNEIQKKYPIFLLRCKQERYLKEADHNIPLPWVIYQDFKTHEEHAVPLASVDLSYWSKMHEDDTLHYQRFGFFSASNGLASGSCLEEALIHSILELMERDAYSYFLIDTFILNKPITIIDPLSLPASLLEKIRGIEKSFQDKLVIIKIPSRFGVPVYIVTFLRAKFPNQPRGAGASLNEEYAIERALFECIQSYHLMHGNYHEKNMSKKGIARHSLIKQVINFPINKLIQKNHFQKIDFPENDAKTLPLGEYLNILIEKVYAHSSLLVQTPYQDEKVTSVRCIIPEAEEFFLITHYLKLMPNSNTQTYIKNHLGHEFSWDMNMEEK